MSMPSSTHTTPTLLLTLYDLYPGTPSAVRSLNIGLVETHIPPPMLLWIRTGSHTTYPTVIPAHLQHGTPTAYKQVDRIDSVSWTQSI